MRCLGCPAPAGVTCPGEYHRRLCTLRTQRPAYRLLVTNWSDKAPAPAPILPLPVVGPVLDPLLGLVLKPLLFSSAPAPKAAPPAFASAARTTPAEAIAPPPVDRRAFAVAPEVLQLVLACPDRGGVLPLSQQADCGCAGEAGAELTECRAGKGTVPGRVTLQACIACRAATLTDPIPSHPNEDDR